MLCLDSDILIAFLRKKPDALAFIQANESNGLATTVINKFELLIGAKISQKKDANLLKVHELVSRLTVLDLSGKDIEECSDVYAELQNLGQKIEMRDVFIGGICRQAGISIVTRNVEHFQCIPRLTIINW
nr:type II toxin-antitoxin system VapC family toxin [Candidatus Sigynarchaeota archaeon]